MRCPPDARYTGPELTHPLHRVWFPVSTPWAITSEEDTEDITVSVHESIFPSPNVFSGLLELTTSRGSQTPMEASDMKVLCKHHPTTNELLVSKSSTEALCEASTEAH